MVVGPRGVVLILGYQGGVARALLELCADPSRREQMAHVERLLLLDEKPLTRLPASWSHLPIEVLPEERVTTTARLAQLLREHAVDQVIDLANIDTLDAIRVCDEANVAYLCSSVQGWPADTAPLADVMQRLMSERKRYGRASSVIGAGMNPGIVNALAVVGMERFQDRVQLGQGADLGLYALLVTEEDRTELVEPEPFDADVFAMTWNPEHALDELLEPHATIVRNGQVLSLEHPPAAASYRVRCKDRMIDALVVPHEEVISLGERYPKLEVAFLYRLLECARRSLAQHPERSKPADWTTRRLYPPFYSALRGSDCVGVLLCSRKYGELWLGFDTDMTLGRRYGTNATQLQVGVGMLAGWLQLGARAGARFVEELDVHEYTAAVESILGPVQEVYEPYASPKTLAARRV